MRVIRVVKVIRIVKARRVIRVIRVICITPGSPAASINKESFVLEATVRQIQA